ncbi:response regulator [Algoriphagus halophytocola]|uniref:Response regulator n=1 Tax=Algoriphagus halophytocola TaxID=2991499 RepID=A0ABY6MKE5_9BACT|nr:MULTISPECIES: response regulator [unclassified Algoriphagus]UZD23131.1 response regulator [Algoriphagus sp. TR-M5]WBL44423.1 response regulator [Algoriphagus sp. TR-M9]
MSLEKPIQILVAEDDEDDKLLILKAFERTLPKENVTCVEDGEALIKYLKRESPYHDLVKYPNPDIILLDLNMPKKDGREALSEIKSNEDLKMIPVIIFTTSNNNDDIRVTYKMGSSSFITKPSSFEGLVQVTEQIENYWSKTVLLPA